LPTYREEANRLQVVLLSLNDVDEIFSLYRLCRVATPYGFLAIRSENDFREIFRNPENVIGTGIRDDGRLIAYSICHRIATNPYPDNPVLSAIEFQTATVYHGDGTAVHPDYHGRMLARRIARLRRQQIADRRVDHVLGLIAVDNIMSIGNVVLAGVLLVGFARDETALNYIAYSGSFRDKLGTDRVPLIVRWNDQEQQQRLFAQQYVVCDLTQPRAVDHSVADSMDERQFTFRPMG
jgi:hypothetical protein